MLADGRPRFLRFGACHHRRRKPEMAWLNLTHFPVSQAVKNEGGQMQACLQMVAHGFYDLAHAIIEGASLKISALFCIYGRRI